MSFIKKFYKYLAENDASVHNKSQAVTNINKAIAYASDNLYTSWDDAVNSFYSDMCKETDGKKFLLDYCGINLDNEDIGSLYGSDIGYTTEQIDYIELLGDFTVTPYNSDEYTIRGITFKFPKNLNAKEKYLKDCLCSAYIPKSIEYVEKFCGLDFYPHEKFKSKTVDVYFNGTDNSSYAYVSWFLTPMGFSLTFNASDVQALDISDKYGILEKDRVSFVSILLHEFTHLYTYNLFPNTLENIDNYNIDEIFTTLNSGIDELYASTFHNNFETNFSSSRRYIKSRLSLNPNTYDTLSYCSVFSFFRYLIKNTSKDTEETIGKLETSEYEPPVPVPENPIFSSGDGKYKYVCGSIEGCYNSWSRNITDGLYTIGDSRYIVMPNGWEGRLWNYPWRLGAIYWVNDTQNTSNNGYCPNNYTSTYYQSNKNDINKKIHDKLFIDFGKPKVIPTENISSIFPINYDEYRERFDYHINTDTFWNMENQLMFILEIYVSNNNTDVEFLFNCEDNNVFVDFGDNEDDKLTKFIYDENVDGMIHHYATSGVYMVKFFNGEANKTKNIIRPSKTIRHDYGVYFNKNNYVVWYANANLSEEDYHVDIIRNIYINDSLPNALFGNGADNMSGDVYGVYFGGQSVESLYLPYFCNISSEYDIDNIFVAEDLPLLETIYIFGEHNNALYVQLVKSTSIKNIYCDEHIDMILSEYLPTSHNYDIYMYTLNVFDISLSDRIENNVTIHVRKVVLDRISAKYPNITFVADIQGDD